MKNSSKLESILICIVVFVGIISLRFVTGYPNVVVKITDSLVVLSGQAARALGLFDIVNFLISIPDGVVMVSIGILRVVLGGVFFLCFRNEMKQGVAIVTKKTGTLVKTGLVVYLVLFLIMLIFAYSVVGLPISLILILIIFVISAIGSVPISIYVGRAAAEILKVSGHMYLYFFLGNFIMVLCESLYAFGGAFILFIFPVLSIGAFVLMVIYIYILKIRFDNDKYSSMPFDRTKIRDIITKGLDE